MNFDVDLPKSQDMLNEIICGYYSVWRRVLMLRESIESAEKIHNSNNNLVCLGAKCIQETLFFSSVTDIKAWFIDSDSKVASLPRLVSKLYDSDFSNKLETWYSTPPNTILIGDSQETKHWHNGHISKKKQEFQYLRGEILKKYQCFIDSDERKRIANLRDKYVAHKEFRNGKLYDAARHGHQLSDAESVLNLIDDFIFDFNKLFNKSSYLESPKDFDRVGAEFWGALKSNII
ncbi:hypothetical protein [Salinivibrio kushneri]|uniref:HEPN AbiU2-like domain-containing protein n=1 Tax=Salinivibrio kushneri TaxID=1908198 RepID=A0AB36K4C2_9GAMM|nr:hypothetical protein [Salinivibrio kushneri]OOE42694.1 hypothetical protein BZG09_12715 [Salinivibrio kushneri]